MQSTVDGVTTSYSLDLVSGLTQVLGDGESTYLYGLGRIGEEGAAGWQYHHGDALGSVRQLTDLNGAVTLAKNYEPYDDLLSSAGDIDTPYDFAGEWRDNTGLIYLRARYYQTTVGRFISRDSWEGDLLIPMSYNLWAYAYANPLRYTDPSGQFPLLLALAPVIGLLAGGTYGYVSYEWALAGECGCDVQAQALSMTHGEWTRAHAISGGIAGALSIPLALLAASSPIGMIGVGTGGLLLSGADLIRTVNVIRNETGFTKCTGTRLAIDVAGVIGSTAGIRYGARAWHRSGSPFKWFYNPPSIPRTLNDIKTQRDYPNPPPANQGNGTIGKSQYQTADLRRWVRALKNLGVAEDIRVNQEQVNAGGIHVGKNKPDLQFTINEQRYYVEWDRPNSGRGIIHAQRIQANDPSATNVLPLNSNYRMPFILVLKEHIILITMP